MISSSIAVCWVTMVRRAGDIGVRDYGLGFRQQGGGSRSPHFLRDLAPEACLGTPSRRLIRSSLHPNSGGRSAHNQTETLPAFGVARSRHDTAGTPVSWPGGTDAKPIGAPRPPPLKFAFSPLCEAAKPVIGAPQTTLRFPWRRRGTGSEFASRVSNRPAIRYSFKIH
jgi:hypothetical protein